MNRSIAQALSYILHPAVFPVLGLIVIAQALPFYISSEALFFSLGIVFTGTYIIPLAVSFVLLQLGILQDIEMKTVNDRRLPYLIGACCFYFTALIMKSLFNIAEIHLFLSASAIVVLIHLMTFRFFKPSAHLAGIGGFTGLLLALSYKYQLGLIPFIALSFFLAGLLGTARLALAAHNLKEVLFGYLSGIIIVTTVLLIS